jgi:hypothetical protein
METKSQQENRKREKGSRRDWDKSEWFRQWLELIKQKPRAAAALAQ